MPKPATSTQRPNRNDEETKEFTEKLAKWTRVLGISTVLLFLTSLGADFFIFQQWRAAIDAQNDSREQLRAYVAFSGGNQIISNNPAGTTINYLFQPAFHNWGATRTSHFSAWASVQYFDKDVPNSQDFSRPFEKVPFTDVTIGGNSSVSLPVSLPVGDAVKAKNGQGLVIIWGHADWADIYEPAKTNSIYFCLKLEPVSSDGDNRIVFQPVPYKPECNTGMQSQR